LHEPACIRENDPLGHRQWFAMVFRFVKALLLLPLPVAVLVPGAIVWATRGGGAAARLAGPEAAVFRAALVCAAAGRRNKGGRRGGNSPLPHKA
jgi:hypothetical protein